jgi:hypothetical protein
MARRKFCNAGCRASYHEDRRQGLLYGGFAVPLERVPAGMLYSELAGTILVNVGWENGCRIYDECLYCRADLQGGDNGNTYKR